MRSGISRFGLLLLAASALGVKKPNPLLKSASLVVTPLLKPVYKYEAPLQEALLGWLPGGSSTKTTRAQIYKWVRNDPVVIYTYALSPFCTEAIRVLESTGCEFTLVELGLEWFLLGPQGSAVRAELGRMTGQTSLPNIFIGGKTVGGLFSGGTSNGGLDQLVRDGTLLGMLRDAGACKAQLKGTDAENPIDPEDAPIERRVEVSDDVPARLTEIVRTTATAAIEAKGAFTIAIAGGSLVNMLGRMASMENVDWSKWHVAWVDERCVAHDAPESNYGAAKEAWLSKVPIPAENIHPIDAFLAGTAEGRRAVTAADDYERKLRDIPPTVLPRVQAGEQNEGMPIFDLLLLGFGPDGHICSLFPGHPLLAERGERWVLPIDDSPKPPAERITLSLPVVNSAAKVVLVGTGSGKAGVVGAAFKPERGDEPLPCMMIGGEPLWLLDTDAASELAKWPDEMRQCHRGRDAPKGWGRRALAAPAPLPRLPGPLAAAGGGLAEEEAWYEEWGGRISCWWLATPYQSSLQSCASAFALHLGQRLQALLHASLLGAPPAVSGALVPESGCEWVQQELNELQLPPFPELGGFEFHLPPLPRLLPDTRGFEGLRSRLPSAPTTLAGHPTVVAEAATVAAASPSPLAAEQQQARWGAAAVGAGAGVAVSALFAFAFVGCSRRR